VDTEYYFRGTEDVIAIITANNNIYIYIWYIAWNLALKYVIK
jgi:hypothetical protein